MAPLHSSRPGGQHQSPPAEEQAGGSGGQPNPALPHGRRGLPWEERGGSSSHQGRMVGGQGAKTFRQAEGGRRLREGKEKRWRGECTLSFH